MKKIFLLLVCSLAVFTTALLFQRFDNRNTFPMENDVSESPSVRQSTTEDDLGSLLSPDGKTLAIPNGNTLILKDTMTTDQKEIPITELSIAPEANGIFLEGWSDDSNALWGMIPFSESSNFFRVVAPSWHVDQYALPHLPWGRDYALNLNTGLVAYSTAPLLLDAEDLKKFEAAQARVVLSVYDLFSGQQKFVAESVAKSFQPRWIANGVLEYTDPVTESRNHYTYP